MPSVFNDVKNWLGEEVEFILQIPVLNLYPRRFAFSSHSEFLTVEPSGNLETMKICQCQTELSQN